MANIFSKLFGSKGIGGATSKFLKDEQSVVGLDIGTSSIKAVQVRRKGGKVILETYGELALGPYVGLSVGQAAVVPTDKLVEALSDLFREANITTKRASLAIPLKSSLLKILELPNLPEKEIEQMIPIEARKYIPVPIGEVELDWWVLPRDDFTGVVDDGEPGDEHKKTEVLLVAIHKETLNRFREIVAKSELVTDAFEVETFSAIRSILGRDVVPEVLLDIGASTSKLSIVDFGIVKVSHTINKGSQDVTMSLATSLGIPFEEAERRKRRYGMEVASGAAPGNVPTSVQPGGDARTVMSSVMDFIFYEANRVVSDYQKKYGRVVRRVYLMGGGAMLRGTKEIAERTFESEVLLAPAFIKTQAPAFLADVLRDAGPEFAISIGLALRGLEEN